MVKASHCVGLTLPGMMEEPVRFQEDAIRRSRNGGPEPKKRTSLAILNSVVANVLSAP